MEEGWGVQRRRLRWGGITPVILRRTYGVGIIRVRRGMVGKMWRRMGLLLNRWVVFCFFFVCLKDTNFTKFVVINQSKYLIYAFKVFSYNQNIKKGWGER